MTQYNLRSVCVDYYYYYRPKPRMSSFAAEAEAKRAQLNAALSPKKVPPKPAAKPNTASKHTHDIITALCQNGTKKVWFEMIFCTQHPTFQVLDAKHGSNSEYCFQPPFHL